jgi:hypothetical protein
MELYEEAVDLALKVGMYNVIYFLFSLISYTSRNAIV